MIAGVADTHAALWYLLKNPLLSPKARAFIEEAAGAGAISLPEIVDTMRQVPRDAVPDMPDRIVTATAMHFGVPVISRDGRIRASRVQTIW